MHAVAPRRHVPLQITNLSSSHTSTSFVCQGFPQYLDTLSRLSCYCSLEASGSTRRSDCSRGCPRLTVPSVRCVMMEASAEESGRPPARNQYTLTTGAIHRRCSDSSPSGKACSPMLPRKHFHIVCARFDVPTSSRQSTLCVRHQNLFLLLRNGNRMHLVTQTLHTHHTLLAPTRLSSRTVTLDSALQR